jgi:hypothetical protein
VHLLGPVAGIWLLARVQQLAGPSLVRRPEWAVLGVLALLGTALAAWMAEESHWRWRWIAINRTSTVLLAAYGSATPSSQAFAWTLASFGLGSALLAISQTPRARHLGCAWGRPLLAWLGALVLWGAPGTVGFLARHSALIFPTELTMAAPLFGIVLIAEILLVASLWQSVRDAETPSLSLSPSSEKSPASSRTAVPLGAVVRFGLAAILLAVPAIAWGFFPRQFARLCGFVLPDDTLTSGLRPAWQLLVTARRSVWIGLAVSAVGGVALGMGRTRVLSRLRGWQRILGEVVSLEWLYRAAVSGLRLAGSSLQYFARLGEGEGYLGWLALAGLVLWVLLRG